MQLQSATEVAPEKLVAEFGGQGVVPLAPSLATNPVSGAVKHSPCDPRDHKQGWGRG